MGYTHVKSKNNDFVLVAALLLARGAVLVSGSRGSQIIVGLVIAPSISLVTP